MPSGAQLSFPAKTTSLISCPRRCLGLCSPSTHRSASMTLDLPQPLGPTIAVIPAGKLNAVLFLNDLNPSSSNCLIRIFPTTPPTSHQLLGVTARDILKG